MRIIRGCAQYKRKRGQYKSGGARFSRQPRKRAAVAGSALDAAASEVSARIERFRLISSKSISETQAELNCARIAIEFRRICSVCGIEH
jgi:hypothetical protein